MSDAAVRATLPVLREAGDPRLPQYVLSLHRPDGWTLREIGDALGVSRERARQLETRAYQQIQGGVRHDLSDLPTYTRRNARRMTAVASAMPPETVELLKTLNAGAQAYRKGHDIKPVQTFNKVVQNLLDAGVPMNEIARASGSSERTFRKRMTRYGIKSSHGKAVDTRAKTQADSKTLSTEPLEVSNEPPKRPCKWPDCPSRLGTGPCIH